MTSVISTRRQSGLVCLSSVEGVAIWFPMRTYYGSITTSRRVDILVSPPVSFKGPKQQQEAPKP